MSDKIKSAAGAIVKRDDNTIIGQLESPGMEKRLASALTATGIDPMRFKRLAVTAIRMNVDLQQCTPMSVLGSLMTAAQLGLEVNTPLGHSYLIPYKRECTLIIGYQGYMALARRSGMVASIMAHAVYEGDEFSFQLGLSPDIKHLPTAEDRESTSKIRYVYAYARFKGGFDPVFVVLSRNKVEQYRRRSPYADKGPWIKDYEAMALKTAIRRLKTWLPLSAQMAEAFDRDGAITYYDDASGVTVMATEDNLPQLDVTPESATEPEIYATEGGAADEKG